MKLLKNGRNTLVSVENISSFGIWLFVKGREYFLSYEEFPYFKDKNVDLDIDNLENPEKYPLRSKTTK